MKNKNLFTFGLLVLVSLPLAGCGSSSTENTVSQHEPEVVVMNTTNQGSIEHVQEDEEKEKNVELPEEPTVVREEEIEEVKIEENNTPSIQTITASEVVYAAKKGDSVQAHPAWLTVTVTLEDDTITGLDIDQQSSSPKSARHQAQFAQQIEGHVIGKKLSESNAIFLSVASTTSQAFNDSIDEIQELYQQSQT